MHGPRCRAAHFITPELPEPGFQELLRLRAVYDSLGAKYCRQREDPDMKMLENPLGTVMMPVQHLSTTSTTQLPTPPNENLPAASSSLKRHRPNNDSESPMSGLPAKKRRQIMPAAAMASASTSSAIPAKQLESSDDDTFPSPYTAFVKSYKTKVKHMSPEIIDPQVIDISDGDDFEIEQLSRTKYKEAIKQATEKKRIQKGKGKAE